MWSFISCLLPWKASLPPACVYPATLPAPVRAAPLPVPAQRGLPYTLHLFLPCPMHYLLPPPYLCQWWPTHPMPPAVRGKRGILHTTTGQTDLTYLPSSLSLPSPSTFIIHILFLWVQWVVGGTVCCRHLDSPSIILLSSLPSLLPLYLSPYPHPRLSIIHFRDMWHSHLINILFPLPIPFTVYPLPHLFYSLEKKLSNFWKRQTVFDSFGRTELFWTWVLAWFGAWHMHGTYKAAVAYYMQKKQLPVWTWPIFYSHIPLPLHTWHYTMPTTTYFPDTCLFLLSRQGDQRKCLHSLSNMVSSVINV